MNENRRKILDMLATGQITADEAERLIIALERDSRRPRRPTAQSRAPSPSTFASWWTTTAKERPQR